MKTIRSFVAAKLDLLTVRSLSNMQLELKERCRRANIEASWVPPPNMHVTVRFLGEIGEPMAYAIKDMLQPIASRFHSTEVSCRGVGAFPDLNNPTVIWAGLGEGAEDLGGLYKLVSDRLLSAGFAIEDRPFRPHITIGRVKKAPEGVLEECLDGMLDADFGESMVRNLYCYRSDLKPIRAEYHQLWRLPFAGARRRVDHGNREPGRVEPLRRRQEPALEETPDAVAEDIVSSTADEQEGSEK
jgi:RNA 2',3'-cyclic 3'-phosphodiesterase